MLLEIGVDNMTAKLWKSRIKKACTQVGSYKKSFDITISILADVLERRDNFYNQYVNEGEQPIVEYTNKGGATNNTANPLLGKIEKCEELANKYLNDLGLTTKGLKSIGGQTEKKEESSFEKIFADLGI